MFHACVERFDVMGGRGNILGWDGKVKGLRYAQKECKQHHQKNMYRQSQQESPADKQKGMGMIEAFKSCVV
jgi:hypothetical protein